MQVWTFAGKNAVTARLGQDAITHEQKEVRGVTPELRTNDCTLNCSACIETMQVPMNWTTSAYLCVCSSIFCSKKVKRVCPEKRNKSAQGREIRVAKYALEQHYQSVLPLSPMC